MESQVAPTVKPAGQPNHAKRPFANGQGGRGRAKKQKKSKAPKEGSSEEVLQADIQAMLASLNISEAGEQADAQPQEQALPEPGTEIEIEIKELSSTGDSLGFQKGSDLKQIYVVPFSVPGDIIKAKVYRHLHKENYTVADFISVVQPSPLRDDSRINCGYFAKCSGCQFQMLDYEEQLRLKKRIVEKAYVNFSQLPPELVPAVRDTMGSPLQYGYRTKLTPHFDAPPGRFGRKARPMPVFTERPNIGFMLKGTRKTIDIEDCPIGSDIVRKGMKNERERVGREYAKYQRGATILLRESTERHAGKDIACKDPSNDLAVQVEAEDLDGVLTPHTDIKSYITDNNATSKEYIGQYVFTNPAGSFFQNNNSILPNFTSYVREHILPKSSSSSSDPKIKYLIDAYCGSGLFTITLASTVPGGSVGIDIDEKSIAFARRNAALNGLRPASPAKISSGSRNCSFIAADANELFKAVKFPPDETVVVLDPPRKGCDAVFLKQLLALGPARVVYVSCNVHTQARDVGILVRGHVEGEEPKEEGTKYEIESLRGFDFFPQTGHVEGVAVLNRAGVETVQP